MRVVEKLEHVAQEVVRAAYVVDGRRWSAESNNCALAGARRRPTLLSGPRLDSDTLHYGVVLLMQETLMLTGSAGRYRRREVRRHLALVAGRYKHFQFWQSG